jgi:hypothetical protein
VSNGQGGHARLSDMSNLDHWLTKGQAAQRLRVAEKTIDRMANKGALQKAQRAQPGRPPVVVFHPDDVEREFAKRQQIIPPFTITGVQTLSNASSEMADRLARPSLAIAKREHVGHVHLGLDMPLSELRYKVYLSEDEAIRYTGLGRGQLAGAVKRGPRGARVYRRTDLEAL